MDDADKRIYNVLTQHTERVFQMLDILKDRKFVGTESKFKDIFHKLKELIDNNTEDPKENRRARTAEKRYRSRDSPY